MRINEITKPLGLEEKHFNAVSVDVPVIDSHLYTNLGRQLFEIYERYSLSPEDQRSMERLSFLLMAYTLHRENSQKAKASWWRRRWI